MISPPEFFHLLSDETRLRSLLLLQQEKELCVCEFSCLLGFTQPKISRHLSLLRTSGLLLDERRGQWVYYRLNEGLAPWMRQALATALESLKEIDPYRTDLKKCATLRQKGQCLS